MPLPIKISEKRRVSFPKIKWTLKFQSGWPNSKGSSIEDPIFSII
jgi:hypothetical protein